MLQVLRDVVVEYEVLAGWDKDISDCKEFDNLPVNAQVYVRRVEVRSLRWRCLSFSKWFLNYSGMPHNL